MNLSTAFSFIAHKPVRRNFIDPPTPSPMEGWRKRAGEGGGEGLRHGMGVDIRRAKRLTWNELDSHHVRLMPYCHA